MNYSEDKIFCFYGANDEIRDVHVWETTYKNYLIVALHDFSPQESNLDSVASYFKKNDVTMLSYDMRRYDSSNNLHVNSFDDLFDDLERLFTYVKNMYSDIPIFIMAHSTGALIAANFALKNEKGSAPIAGYILSSPYFESYEPMSFFRTCMVKLTSRLMPQKKCRISGSAQKQSKNFSNSDSYVGNSAHSGRPKALSGRVVSEIIKAQEYVRANIHKWSKPLFIISAGADRVSNSVVAERLIRRIDRKYVHFRLYPFNLNDNFNAENSIEIFGKIKAWQSRKCPEKVSEINHSSGAESEKIMV